MKKHLLGFCVALFFAFTSFYVSPIRFDTTALGIGSTNDGLGRCGFYPQYSNHFVQLFWNGCFFETKDQASNYFSEEIKRLSDLNEETAEIQVESKENHKRARVESDKDNKHFFCVIRQDERSVTDICSTSLRHTLEFEQQKFVKFDDEQ
jgi:hypothetical protein